MRAQGDGSIFPRTVTRLRPDGTSVATTYWTAQVTLEDGRKRRRSAATRAEARLRLAELQQHAAASTIDGSRLTLRAYLEGWLADVRPNLAPATWRKHEQHIRNHIAPALGHRRLSDLSVTDVRRFLAATHVGPQSARHHRATLRRALADAVREGLVQRNVAALAEPPKLDTKERPVLTADQVRVLIDGTRDTPYHALWTLLATTGLREAEALALTWEDIDLGSDYAPVPAGGRGPDAVLRVQPPRATGGPDHAGHETRDVPGVARSVVAGAHVRVKRTLHRVPRTADTPGRWEFRTTKTAKSRRTVFLPEVAVIALRAHYVKSMERWLEAGRPGDGQMVFTDTKGRPVHGSKLTEILYPILDGLGLPRVGPHGLRHTAATMLYEAGVDINTIADMLGHATPRITAELYRHKSHTLQQDASDAMQRVVGQ